jgi:hypothetical protein
LSEAEINDKNLVESLEGDTKSMELVVSARASLFRAAIYSLALQNTIFSSIVASFIIETQKTLQPNNGQQSVSQLAQQTSIS